MDHGILMAGWMDLGWWINLLKAALGLGVVIFVHELGHFLVAKMCGVKCEKFYVGFDPPMRIGPIKLPRTLFRKQWGETEYGIGIIPLGGYVKMLGQDDNPANAANEAERIQVPGEEGNGAVGPATLNPRSYPAKSVPQRMAIISAGVAMNLVFAVIFATIAYQMGVSYTPCLIGATSVGDPAWRAGLLPGDRIIQLGRDAPESEHLRFIQDLKMKMFSLNVGDEVDLQIQNPTGDRRWVTLAPDAGFKKQVGTPTIGITMAHEPTVALVFEDSVAAAAGLKPDDLIQAVTVDSQRTSIQDGFELQALLARYPTQPLTLTVSRVNTETKTPETKQIELPAVPVRRVGLELTMGPITVVQSGSTAERAGFRVGDILREINGQPIGDPMTLPLHMLDFIGQPITVTVQRGNARKQIEVTPVAPKMIPFVRRRNGPIGLETVGVGYQLRPTIQRVMAGSPAERAGIVAGDVLKSVELVPVEPARGIRKMLAARELAGAIDIDAEKSNWPWVFAMIEEFPIEFKMKLVVDHNGRDKTETLVPEPSETMFDPLRGFALNVKEEVRTAASLGDAFAMGRKETLESMKQVVVVLRKIKETYKHLGGPLTIAAVGTMEASEGLPRLLMFLTMLSANLAVLNFLPIPVLDGGHMIFLAYEGIVGKPVNERFAFGLTIVGFGLLMGLMVFVFALDIDRLFG